MKLACCYLGAANAAAEVVQVVLPQTSILQPLAARRLLPVHWHTLCVYLGGPSYCTTLSFHHSLSFRRTNHPNKTLKMLKILISAVQLQPSKGSRGSLVEFCQETPRGPNPWFHVFPPLPNSRGFTSIDLIRLQKRSTVHHPTALAAG